MLVSIYELVNRDWSVSGMCLYAGHPMHMSFGQRRHARWQELSRLRCVGSTLGGQKQPFGNAKGNAFIM